MELARRRVIGGVWMGSIKVWYHNRACIYARSTCGCGGARQRDRRLQGAIDGRLACLVDGVELVARARGRAV